MTALGRTERREEEVATGNRHVVNWSIHGAFSGRRRSNNPGLNRHNYRIIDKTRRGSLSLYKLLAAVCVILLRGYLLQRTSLQAMIAGVFTRMPSLGTLRVQITSYEARRPGRRIISRSL